MDFETARVFFDVNQQELTSFDIVDPFNPSNQLKGYLCQHSDHRYGALLIYQVNDEECHQVIWGTPKLHYPFDKNGQFHWPPIDGLEIWQKLDGTNICAYSYVHKGTRFITYKTRLTTVINDSHFGSFRVMWQELLDRYIWIHEVIRLNPEFNLSFEMWGSRNPITIAYHDPLEATLLFGINYISGDIVPPSALKLPQNAILPTHLDSRDWASPSDFYNQIRKQLSELNQQRLTHEGVVWYILTSGQWRMFKCKPEEIEKIHWTAGGKIPKASIWTTVLNAFESNPLPTIQYINQLLLEEFDEHLVNKNQIQVQKLYEKAIDHMQLVKKANEVWILARNNGFDVVKDKNATMRFISQYFDKITMGKIAGIILKQAGLS